MMNCLIDFSAYELFNSFLAGALPLDKALNHPAYITILTHARKFGNPFTQQDIEEALSGEPSPFYGVTRLKENQGRIYQLKTHIQEHCTEWVDICAREIHRVLPEFDLCGIKVYPVLGYDMGIGLGESICMNLNVEAYLRNPLEFLYYMIHEIVHILYERCHTIPSVQDINGNDQWRKYYALWVQNEGFAVYVPLHIRMNNQHMNERDYRLLLDKASLFPILNKFKETRMLLQSNRYFSYDEYMEMTFGNQRVTYRAGCEIIRRIEQKYGIDAVREAFHMKGEPFLINYESLINS